MVLTNGRRLYLRDVDVDSDAELVFGTNHRGRRVWLFRRLIATIG